MPSVITERAKFHRKTQQETESIAEFVASLRRSAETYNFGANLEETLRDRFVCGLARTEIQKKFFVEDASLDVQKGGRNRIISRGGNQERDIVPT